MVPLPFTALPRALPYPKLHPAPRNTSWLRSTTPVLWWQHWQMKAWVTFNSFFGHTPLSPSLLQLCPDHNAGHPEATSQSWPKLQPQLVVGWHWLAAQGLTDFEQDSCDGVLTDPSQLIMLSVLYSPLRCNQWRLGHGSPHLKVTAYIHTDYRSWRG